MDVSRLWVYWKKQQELNLYESQLSVSYIMPNRITKILRDNSHKGKQKPGAYTVEEITNLRP